LPSKTARLLAGLPVKGRHFAPNTAWCEWARANGCLPTREEEVDEIEEFEVGVEERSVAMEDKLNGAKLANNLKSDVPVDDAALVDEWSALDGQGINDLFGRIFFEGERHGANFTCFLDADGDSDGESEGIGRLFDEESSDHKDAVAEFEELPDNTDKP
uniref:Condensin complex subunit 2 n=1 Tax=Taenia asiatica TaxID=60517 RepID=A0A0R3W0F4_TAEAS